MTFFLIIPLLVVLMFVLARAQSGSGPRVTPAEAAQRVESGNAVLIDVREPNEWSSGVARPALLLSLSDLHGTRKSWKSVLEKNRKKELILYCRSGSRSGMAARLLAKEGFNVANAGGFSAWKNAGLPTRNP